MRSLALAVASFALLTGTSAVAQIVDGSIGYQAGSSYQTPAFSCTSSNCFDTNPLPEGAGRYPETPGATGGASYNSFVTIGAEAITFESSNAVAEGPFLSFTSSSTVSFAFNNPTDGAVAFHSEITPQGLGMYLADTSGGCVLTNSCMQVSDEIHQFSQLNALGVATNGVLGGVGFSFQILDNESAIYTLTGTLILARNVLGCDGVCFIDGLGSEGFFEGEFFIPPTGARSLDGFEQKTLGNDFSARAYGWEATDVLMSLGSGSHFIEYRTTVTSFTSADCLGPTSSVCLLAYSGFGDPIGRGGAIDAAFASFSFDVGALDHGLGGGGPITHLDFDPQSFKLPTFESGRLIFNSSGMVPEPTTWALMILGFGAAGAALRRRRIPAHI